jgi:hypothetical protein
VYCIDVGMVLLILYCNCKWPYQLAPENRDLILLNKIRPQTLYETSNPEFVGALLSWCSASVIKITKAEMLIAKF